MSGFDVNVLSSKPVIRETANMQNDGGAGNLGYMQRRDDEKKKKQQISTDSIFSKHEPDTFTLQDVENEDEKFSFSKLCEKLISFIKKLFG